MWHLVMYITSWMWFFRNDKGRGAGTALAARRPSPGLASGGRGAGTALAARGLARACGGGGALEALNGDSEGSMRSEHPLRE